MDNNDYLQFLRIDLDCLQNHPRSISYYSPTFLRNFFFSEVIIIITQPCSNIIAKLYKIILRQCVQSFDVFQLVSRAWKPRKKPHYFWRIVTHKYFAHPSTFPISLRSPNSSLGPLIRLSASYYSPRPLPTPFGPLFTYLCSVSFHVVVSFEASLKIFKINVVNYVGQGFMNL